ncbi:zf-CCHC_4 domain-containing protein [Cephalotus follicularis]|uniref:Zf-CCHC_4 domain-containing protein n=1 Tax=Cephalotus follicularis TaxID=3775 RepID=A0A1Q3BYM7_CEPFO|nr:zf-CCHC_4 domain-containing protein [Cephalotus follicularis]
MLEGVWGIFARLCIQIYASKPLVSRIRIGSFLQLVQYEDIKSICFGCECIGHKKDSCPLMVKDFGSPAKVKVLNPSLPTVNSGLTDGKRSEAFGSWMFMEKRPRKKGVLLGTMAQGNGRKTNYGN